MKQAEVTDARTRAGRLAVCALLAVVAFGGLLGSREPASRASSGNAGFVRGAIVLAGSGIEWLEPTGAFPTGPVPRSLTPTQQRFFGVALDSAGAVFALGSRPVLYHFDSDGKDHGSFGGFPDGLVPTALTAKDPDSIYMAISDNGVLHEIYRFNDQGVTPVPVLVPAKVTAMDVAADGCTIIYATPAPGLRRLDWCAGRQLPDFSVASVITAVRALPDGSALATTGGPTIVRMAEGGAVVRTYRAAGANLWTGFDLAPDGSSFWAGTLTGKLYRFDLASGAVLQGPIAALPSISAVAVQGAPRGRVSPGLGPPPAEGVSLDGATTLTGEGFSALGSGAPTPPSQCTTTVPVALGFSASGQTIGPYRGQFSAMVTATVGPQNVTTQSGLLGVDAGRLSGVEGTFSAGGGAVKGTFLLPSARGTSATGVCRVFRNETFPGSPSFPGNYALSGYYRNVRARGVRYRAKLQKNGAVYVDEGVTSFFADEYDLRDRDGRSAGSAMHWTQAFVSDRLSVADAFSSRGQQVPHTAGITRLTKRLTVTIRWPSAGERFSLTQVAQLQSNRSASGRVKLKPGKLKITTVRRPTSVTMTITNLRPGKVAFKIAADRLTRRVKVGTTVAGS